MMVKNACARIKSAFGSIFYHGKHEYYDYTLIFVVFFLMIFGLIMVYSTTSYSDALTSSGAFASVKKQALFAVAAVFIMAVISKLDYHVILKFAPAAGLLVLALCVMVMFVGKSSNGSSRWLEIGGISIQPSEFAKPALILVLARYLTLNLKSRRRTTVSHEIDYAVKGILITLLFAAPVIGENLSTGLIILMIGYFMVYIPNQYSSVFWLLIAAGIIALVVGWQTGLIQLILKDYQEERVNAWMNPEADASDSAYQILQGLYAIGSGGLFGKGLGNSIQKLGFLPEAQNDMIFAIICEELGLFGALILIGLYVFLLYRLLCLADRAPDLSGALLVLGVMIHIALQVLMNIAVVTNSMPNTGVTLPFISSGGSALICIFAEIGLVLSVTNQIAD